MTSTAHRLALAGAIGAAMALGAITSCAPGESAPAPTPVPVPCQVEDGSTPGQAFPCRWDAARQGNGRGESYTLTVRVCTDAEIAASDAAHRAGRPDPGADCDDWESSRVPA